MPKIHGRKKEKLQIDVDVEIHKITKLAKKDNGNTVYISWRRGTKKKKGDTKRALVDRNEALFDEKISFTSIFFANSSGKYDEKILTLVIKQDKMKKKKSGKASNLGKLKINISDYMNSEEVQHFPLKKKSDSELLITVHSKPVKYGNSVHNGKLNRITRSNRDDDENKDKLIKEIGGEEYFLESGSSLSDTTQSSASQMNDEDDSVESSDPFEGLEDEETLGDEDETVLQETPEELLKQIEFLEAESYERLKTIQKKDEEIENLKKQLNGEFVEVPQDSEELIEEIQDLKKTIEKQEKKIQLLEKQKKKMLSGSTISSDADDCDIKNLEDANEEKDQEISSLELTVKQLKKEVQNLKKNSGSFIENGKNGIHDQDKVSKDLEYLQTEYEHQQFIMDTVYNCEYKFKNSAPVSATTIASTLQAWSSFEDDNSDTNLSKLKSQLPAKVTNAMETVCKRAGQNIQTLAYWLSTACFLLRKLKKSSDFDEDDSYDEEDEEPQNNMSNLERFEISITSLVFKIYTSLVQNIYQILDPFLCQVFLLQNSSLRDSQTPEGISVKYICELLANVFDMLEDNYVPEAVIEQIFSQTLFYANGTLWNSLTPAICTCENAFQIKMELTKFVDWTTTQHPAIRNACHRLELMFEVTNVLVMDKKILQDEEVRSEICPSLKLLQLKHLLEIFKPDRLVSEPVATSVIKALEIEINDDNEEIEIDTSFIYRLSLSFLNF